MLVDNMNIEKGFVEADVEGDPFDVSDADTMLNYINAEAELPDVITMFSKIGCGFCQKAKDLLNKKGLAYEEFELGHGASMSSLANVTGSATTPQIYINQKHVGGFEELQKHINEA